MATTQTDVNTAIKACDKLLDQIASDTFKYPLTSVDTARKLHGCVLDLVVVIDQYAKAQLLMKKESKK